MTDILTAAQGALFVRTTASDTIMLQLIPLVTEHVIRATGRDWTKDTTISPMAIAAAGSILTAWYDNPAMVGQASDGAIGALTQLEAEAMKYRKYIFRGLSGQGIVIIDGLLIGDAVIALRGYFGVSGDQHSKFASVASWDYQLDQTANENLSDNRYMVIVKSPVEDFYP